tara:strand:+ start:1149 stop:1856 length:708 start_codon:yes stop_codon:yes gene_type:complete
MIKLAIAISTYAVKKENEDRLQKCVDSLMRSGFSGRIIVVDDGSEMQREVRGVLAGRIKMYRRDPNGGISKCKNTCIRLITEREYDIGFLADDDLLFEKNWWVPYVEAIKTTKLGHFSWAKHKKGVAAFKINEHLIYKTMQLNGCLMTFTPKIIEAVGGLPTHPESKWGWDHVPWSNRINRKFFPSLSRGEGLDVTTSNELVKLQEAPSAVTIADRRRNRGMKFLEEKVYLPLEE